MFRRAAGDRGTGESPTPDSGVCRDRFVCESPGQNIRWRPMAKQSTYAPLLKGAKDLAHEAPRSPRQRLGGYAIMARMIDKGRATIAGNAGEYHFNCPVDQMLFAFKALSLDEAR